MDKHMTRLYVAWSYLLPSPADLCSAECCGHPLWQEQDRKHAGVWAFRSAYQAKSHASLQSFGHRHWLETLYGFENPQ
jgi:hypothetical protein